MTNGDHSPPIQNYQALNHVLGEGANSTVFLGRNVHTSEDVALKLTDYSNLTSTAALQLQNEVNILRKLASYSENQDFLHLYDVIEQDGEVCLATEYIPGGDLSDYCDLYPNGIPERIGKWVFQKLLKATDSLHSKDICHRDIKLENVMYNKENHKLKLIDFGFAAETNDYDDNGKKIQKMHKDHCGSVHYVSPEIVMHKQYDGKKADMWALGILLFVLLSGFFPFDDVSNGRPEIIFDKIVAGEFFMPSHFSSHVTPLLRKMLHRDPSKRPSAEELLKDPWFAKGNW